MVKHVLVALQTKRMLALWTVILLLVPAALLGKLYEPSICNWSINNQIYHVHPNTLYISRPRHLSLDINYAMSYLIVKGQNPMKS